MKNKHNINPNKQAKCKDKLEDLLNKNRISGSNTQGITHITLNPTFQGKYTFNKEERNKCLFVCSVIPFFTSIRTIETLDKEPPVIMFLVYCTCPGVSETMYFLFFEEKYLYATSIVIPCSCSSFNPSVNKEKSISPLIFDFLFIFSISS